MIFDQSSSTDLFSIIGTVGSLSNAVPQESEIPGAGPILRETVVLGARVETTIYLGASVDNVEI